MLTGIVPGANRAELDRLTQQWRDGSKCPQRPPTSDAEIRPVLGADFSSRLGPAIGRLRMRHRTVSSLLVLSVVVLIGGRMVLRNRSAVSAVA
jgi:hypothetical protein